MKIKCVLSLIFLTMLLQQAKAQKHNNRYPYWEGAISIGIIPTFVKDQSQTEFPPIQAGLNYRMNERFSLGMIAGHTRVASTSDLLADGSYEQFKNKFTIVGLRFAVHSMYFEKWDLYGGMNTAYAISGIEVVNGNIEKLKKHLNYQPVTGKMMISAFLGAKFLLKPRTTLFGELGYGISLLSVGITRKL